MSALLKNRPLLALISAVNFIRRMRRNNWSDSVTHVECCSVIYMIIRNPSKTSHIVIHVSLWQTGKQHWQFLLKQIFYKGGPIVGYMKTVNTDPSCYLAEILLKWHKPYSINQAFNTNWKLKLIQGLTNVCRLFISMHYLNAQMIFVHLIVYPARRNGDLIGFHFLFCVLIIN